MGEVIMVKDPIGATWRMKLLTDNKGTKVHQGWVEFQDFYAIKRHYFLVFRYNGNSQFTVTIFDKAGQEIDYPRRLHETTKRKQLHPISGEEKDEEEGEDDNDDDEDDADSVEILWEKSWKEVKEAGSSSQQATTSRRTKRSRSSSSALNPKNEDLKAYQQAMLFNSNHPFFICVIRSGSISGSFRISMRRKFVRENLAKNLYEEFKLHLQVNEENSWSVRVITEAKDNIGRIGGGWKIFVHENNVELNDVCIFEMHKEQKPYLQIKLKAEGMKFFAFS
ncbi:OLC1v1001570C1 [Oldenlandia corymbosa var. corymbosa]|uniref:OLC1v1001570C1 n=1 Tax=Oldenlandia corymbosa var. corymbosa TaxID=529605 RepID=A0AAV1D5J1_OLDCO|nr:OLC1v1001570C1 [Oldenlandia corymbosa var. corymbosa]